MSVEISVIMSVYNCEPYISEAIDSILNQTFQDWELIIRDDGSTDRTWEIVKQYKKQYPDKIHAGKNRRNRKQGYTRNKCLEKASGRYIAIMDGDDICSPERFETEWRFLESHPDISVVGTRMAFFDENGVWGDNVRGSRGVSPVRGQDFLKGPALCAATCMMRREAVEAVGGYDSSPAYYYEEDYDLLLRMQAAGFKGVNLSDELYFYREVKETYQRRSFTRRLASARMVCRSVDLLQMPQWKKLYAGRTIAIGLLPLPVYISLHKFKYGRNRKTDGI